MRVQPVEGGEGVPAALHLADEGLLLGVDADVHLEAVGGEEGLAAALLGALELVVARVGLVMGAEVALRRVGAATAGKVAEKLLGRFRARSG